MRTVPKHRLADRRVVVVAGLSLRSVVHAMLFSVRHPPPRDLGVAQMLKDTTDSETSPVLCLETARRRKL